MKKITQVIEVDSNFREKIYFFSLTANISSLLASNTVAYTML